MSEKPPRAKAERDPGLTPKQAKEEVRKALDPDNKLHGIYAQINDAYEEARAARIAAGKLSRFAGRFNGRKSEFAGFVDVRTDVGDDEFGGPSVVDSTPLDRRGFSVGNPFLDEEKRLKALKETADRILRDDVPTRQPRTTPRKPHVGEIAGDILFGTNPRTDSRTTQRVSKETVWEMIKHLESAAYFRDPFEDPQLANIRAERAAQKSPESVIGAYSTAPAGTRPKRRWGFTSRTSPISTTEGKSSSVPVSEPESKSEPKIEPPSVPPPAPEVLPKPDKKRKPKREAKPEPVPASASEPEAAPAPMPAPEPAYETPVAFQEGEITQGIEASEFEKAQAEYLEAASRYQLDSGHAPYASEAEGEADVVGKLKRMLTLQNVFEDYQETVNETLFNLKATRDSRLYHQSMMRGMRADIGSIPTDFGQRVVDTSVPFAKVESKKPKKKRSLLGMIGAGFLAAFGIGGAVAGKMAYDKYVASSETPPEPELDPLMKKAVPFRSVVESPEEAIEDPKPASELSPEEARRSRNEPASRPEEASLPTRKRGG